MADIERLAEVMGLSIHSAASSERLRRPDEPDELRFETIRRFKGMEREVVVLVELPTAGKRLDELLHVGLTRATTECLGRPVPAGPVESVEVRGGTERPRCPRRGHGGNVSRRLGAT